MSNLSKLLSRSGTLVQQGDLAGARAELEKALRDHGRRPEPWISLAAVHGMSGNYPEALRCAQKSVELAPQSLQGWINLAGAARSTGNFALAAEALQQARGLPGCPAQVAQELGPLLMQLERWSEAEPLLRGQLARNPADREALVLLAMALARNGKAEDSLALIEEYRRRQPQDMETLLRIGRMYCESGFSKEAWHCCDRLLQEQPDNTEALFFKVDLLDYDGRPGEAMDTLDQLGRLLPANSRVLSYLATISHSIGRPDDSISYAREALKIDPDNLSVIVTLCSALLTPAPAEARQLLERAEGIDPGNLAVITLKGHLLEIEGDQPGAWACAAQVVNGGSLDSTAAVVAARVAHAVGKSAETIDMLERLLERPGHSVSSQRILRFALAQLCDKARQYERAFAHAVIANRLKGVHFDYRSKLVRFNRLKAVYSETAMASLPKAQLRSALPVFIVGMPRSGTSLLEQILSCHSQVHARGETYDLSAMAESIAYYPDGVRNLGQAKCDALAADFLRRLTALAPAAQRITDKMPSNYLYLGMVSQILPGAQIINCRRDPRDVCLSNFMIDFLSANNYAYDLEALAYTCKEYQELMAHWKQVLDLPILDVRYEDLIADPQTWVARVLEFCGLGWEDACLNFHQSDRQVLTASYDQVRKPLYKSSVARWKAYEKQLEPVSRILGLTDDSYP